MAHRNGCLVCGKDLKYLEETGKLRCEYCRDLHDAHAICVDGHFICDFCHQLGAEDAIEQYCTRTDDKDPIALATTLMRNPRVKMHGSEHHFLVPAVLLTSYYNTVGEPYKKTKVIGLARQRAGMVKEGFCGLLGDCGAAVGTGIFVSLVTGATPLSREEWRLSNLVTAKSLEVIALHGGPRCCKRNAFLAIRNAVNFVKEHFETEIPVTHDIICEFSPLNTECLTKDCPFYPVT